jgi:RimJ/RimL family protein N-acetyltransferase
MTETWTAGDGTVVAIRPIRAADLALEQQFVKGLSSSTAYQRLMSTRTPLLDELKRWTDIDPEHECALIATTLVAGATRQIAVARYAREPSAREAEFAIVIADDWQGRGLGTRLLAALIEEAKRRGIPRLFGTTFATNTGMVALARRLGFHCAPDPRSATITNLTLEL